MHVFVVGAYIQKWEPAILRIIVPKFAEAFWQPSMAYLGMSFPEGAP